MNLKKINIFFWFLASLLLLSYRLLFPLDGLVVSGIVNTFIDIIIMYATASLINRYLIPVILHKKSALLFVLSLILTIYFSANVIRLLQGFWYHAYGSLNKEEFEVLQSIRYQIFNSYLVMIVGSTFICSYHFVLAFWKSKKRNEILEMEKVQTELKFLKAQINPHFLFNSLNIIYAEVEERNTKARDVVLKFSEMLRYQLYDCNVDRIPIKKEISYIKNYIALQSLRKNDDFQLNLFIGENIFGFEIAPLLLIPFIENAFKYLGNSEEKKNILEIKMTYIQKKLSFFCSNSKAKIRSRDILEDGGIGIKNVQRRLELLYPSLYDLQINDSDDFFNIDLKITIR